MENVGTALAEMTIPQISPLAGEPIDRSDAERLAGVLKALADPARLRLLSLIQSAPEGVDLIELAAEQGPVESIEDLVARQEMSRIVAEGMKDAAEKVVAATRR